MKSLSVKRIYLKQTISYYCCRRYLVTWSMFALDTFSCIPNIETWREEIWVLECEVNFCRHNFGDGPSPVSDGPETDVDVWSRSFLLFYYFLVGSTEESFVWRKRRRVYCTRRMGNINVARVELNMEWKVDPLLVFSSPSTWPRTCGSCLQIHFLFTRLLATCTPLSQCNFFSFLFYFLTVKTEKPAFSASPHEGDSNLKNIFFFTLPVGLITFF